jgi:tetratricopeptide (TPR) repeat protein
MLEWDTRAARSAYSQAIALNPSHVGAHRAYAVLLASLGRHTQAIRESTHACELDPLCLLVNTHAAWVRFAAGDYAAVIEQCRHTLEMDARYASARRLLGAAYLMAGQERQALETLQAAANGGEADPVAMAWLVHARAALGDRAGAAGLLTRLERMARLRYVPPFHLAIAYAGLEDADATFAALERAAADRDPLLPNVGVDPRFASMRGDRRFAELVAKLGL